jgi:hypothetical protein
MDEIRKVFTYTFGDSKTCNLFPVSV